jgi:hypothetical protein
MAVAEKTEPMIAANRYSESGVTAISLKSDPLPLTIMKPSMVFIPPL